MTETDLSSAANRVGLVREFGATPFQIPGFSRSLALSPDGAVLATMGESLLVLLDAHSGAVLRRKQLAPGSRFEQVGFSSDGVLLFIGGWSNEVHVFDARSLAHVRTIDTGYRNVMALASCPGAPHVLFTGGFDQHARLWDLRSGSVLCELPYWEQVGDATAYVHKALFAPDGSKLVTITYQGADLWEVPSGAHLAHVADKAFCPAGAAFSPDGEDLYVGNNVGRFALVNPRTGTMELERDVVERRSSAHSMFVTSDGDSLVCCSEDGAAHVLSPSNLKLQRTVPIGGSLGVGAALAPDGDTLYVNDERGGIVRISVSEGSVDRPVRSGVVHGLAFLDDDNIVALHQFGLLTKGAVSTGDTQNVRFSCGWQCALSPRGTRAALSSADNAPVTTIVDTVAAKIVGTSAIGGGVIAVSDAGVVCTSTERGVLYGERGSRIEAPAVRQWAKVAFALDDKTLLVRSNAEVVRIDTDARSQRDVAKVSRGEGLTGDRHGRVVVGSLTKVNLLGDEATKAAAEVFVFKGEQISTVATAEDGSIIAAGSDKGHLLLMRRAEPKSAISVPVFSVGIAAVALSRDATKVAIASGEPEILVFDTRALFDAFASKSTAKKDKKPTKSEPLVDDSSSDPKKKGGAKKGKAKK